jgi:copper chaperone CopZ
MKNLLLLSILAFFVSFNGCGKSDNQTSQNKDKNTVQKDGNVQTDNKESNTKENTNMNNSGEYKTVEIKTKGMTCSHCENSVKTEVNKLSSIKEVIADATTNTVKVTYLPGKTEIKDIEHAIDEAGYEVVEVIQ